VTEPSSVLRKKALIVERGHFKHVEPFNQTMLEASLRYVRSLAPSLQSEPLSVVETTILTEEGKEIVPTDEILDRVRRMQAMGPVIVSDFPQNYLLVDYLRRFTTERIYFVIGVSTLARVFDEQRYRDLPGGLLEGLGKMLAKNVRVLAFPMPTPDYLAALGPLAADFEPLPASLHRVTASDIRLKPPMGFLYDYVRGAGWIEEL
jgi:hypothetical protein